MFLDEEDFDGEGTVAAAVLLVLMMVLILWCSGRGAAPAAQALSPESPAPCAEAA